MEQVRFGVLGPVVAERGGTVLALKGPRHRAVLARLIIARGRVVPVSRLVAELWEEPPAGAVGAVQTFVAALRRALEPERPPRARPRLLVTEGPGYALRAASDAVDAWRFEAGVGAVPRLPPEEALERLDGALALWRGPAYADFAEEPWCRGERSRLAELRLHAVERRAEARLALGLAAEAAPDLDAHVADHPWREDAWRLLALALYRTGRQGDALAVLRRARAVLVEQLGLDPGPGLRRLEADVLAQSPALDVPGAAAPGPRPGPASVPPESGPRPGAPDSGRETGATRDASDARDDASAAPASGAGAGADVGAADPDAAAVQAPASGAGPPADGTRPATGAAPATEAVPAPDGAAPTRLWTEAAAAYDRTVAAGARARLEATVALIRDLAVTGGGGGLAAARQHRMAALASAEEFEDPELTARVIGAFDVPAIWTRSDDPSLAARITAAAEHTLAALPSGPAHEPARCRLLATVAVEMRGTRDPRGPEAAREAERIARRLGDPALLAFALNGRFMQACTRAGLAPRRDAIGAELVELAARHGMATFEVLGHLVRLQARSALGDLPGADGHAAAADALAARRELPLVGVFTAWYRALRAAATGRGAADAARTAAAYRSAADLLEGAGMPGLERGILPLALLCLRLRPADGWPPADAAPRTGPLPVQDAAAAVDLSDDWGPYRPWAEPFALLAAGEREAARRALHALPEPPADLLYEALCALHAVAARELGDTTALHHAADRLRPAAGELAGAGSGLLTLGPVEPLLP